MSRLTIAALGAALLAATPALAADPENGEKVFKKCQTCHDIKAEKNKVGPHLVGIVGRPAGSVEGFKYSEAMKSSGVTWTEENIAIYLKDPKGFIKGNKMAFPGLKKDDEVADVIAYLKQPES
jgi:cytochrome c